MGLFHPETYPQCRALPVPPGPLVQPPCSASPADDPAYQRTMAEVTTREEVKPQEMARRVTGMWGPRRCGEDVRERSPGDTICWLSLEARACSLHTLDSVRVG